MARPKKYPDELIARGVPLALEGGRPIAHVAAEVGRYIDEHRGHFGVEPICRTLDVSASACCHRAPVSARSA